MKTDLQLKQDVTNELAWEPSVVETHVGVTVKNGIVTLSGHVPSFGEKYGAEKAARRVLGVKAVADELDVRIASDRTRSDEDIAVACVNALREHAAVPEEKIQVVVRDGRVTLEGTVEWQYQKAAAENAIRFLIGVKGITNSIQLIPRALARDVKNEIEAAFVRSAEIDASRIHVETHAGKVILHGQVRSLAEKLEAQSAAWSAPGVNCVENDIVVVAP